MNISIGEKKAFGCATPYYKRLEDYRRCRGATGGIRASQVQRGIAEEADRTTLS